MLCHGRPVLAAVPRALAVQLRSAVITRSYETYAQRQLRKLVAAGRVAHGRPAPEPSADVVVSSQMAAGLVGDSMRTRMAMEVEHAKLEADAKAADVLISGQFASGLVGDGMRTRMAVMEVAPSKHAAKHLPATAWESYAQRQLRLQAELRAKADDAELAAVIDHTLLKPSATAAEIEALCEEARTYGFATVCVNGSQVAKAAALLNGCFTRPIAVVGFPLGAGSSAAKAAETADAVAAGAAEIDMVLNIGALIDGEHAAVQRDIQAVVAAAAGMPVKVILETSMLDDQQKVYGCSLAKAAGAAFVKTSTGFGGGGATVADIELMRSVVGPDIGVKASGGVRTAADVRAMIAAGATRVGASAGVDIASGATGQRVTEPVVPEESGPWVTGQWVQRQWAQEQLY